MISTTLENYEAKFKSMLQEIKYLDQQCETLFQQMLKVQGAIEALKTLEPETDVED